MIVVGLTGGIGSGKSTLARNFEAYGIPVYYADIEAKALMNRSKVIKRKLTALFGTQAYTNGVLNKSYLSASIFSDQTLLTKMNAIVHPKVAAHFKKWLKSKNTPYVVKEAAIIFENNQDPNYDLIITVVADKHLRISRVMKRDNTTKEKVEAIMKNQLSDAEKIKRSNYVIYNNNLETAKLETFKIHKNILQKITAE